MADARAPAADRVNVVTPETANSNTLSHADKQLGSEELKIEFHSVRISKFQGSFLAGEVMRFDGVSSTRVEGRPRKPRSNFEPNWPRILRCTALSG